MGTQITERQEDLKRMEENTKWEVISKQEAEHCRHRLEKRWYRRLIECNVLLIALVCGFVFANLHQYQKLVEKAWAQMQEEAEGIGEQGGDASRQEEGGRDKDSGGALSLDDIPFELQLFGYGIFLMVAVYIGLYLLYANARSMSLRITEHNFPEVYQMIQEYAGKLGMESVPKAYVTQSGGVLNAYSAFIFRKQYIQIHSEIFEVAYREHHDMDALGFVIAHEMAHIYYGHATLHYNLPIWFSMQIPLIGSIASRAREYSADRLAQKITGTDGVEAMFMLMVDRHLYKMVDRRDYLREAGEQKGFFIWLVNLFADHPILCKRIRALDRGEGSGELY